MATSRFSTLNAWLAWLESLHPKEIDLGLARVKQVAQTMDLLRPSAKVITVAGTNGKGSYVKALSRLLIAEGASIGAFSSPHLLHYNERIAIDGSYASDEAICSAFQAIDDARGDISLTYFEFGTLAALYLFDEAKLDYWILEVGLGGRLDAVNIVDADISVITSVDIDHEAWLGNDREVIGKEKAGILRENCPFICTDENIPKSVISHAKALNCDSYLLGETLYTTVSADSTIIECRKREEQESMRFQLKEHQLPLPSLAAAIQTYCLLFDDVDTHKVSSLVEEAKLEGRFESLTADNQAYLLDVAHNPQAAKLLANALKQKSEDNLIAIFTCMQDKNLLGIVEPLRPLIKRWVCVDIPGLARSRKGSDIADQLLKSDMDAVFEISPEQGLERARQLTSDPNQPILVLGSFFLIAEIKALLGQS